MLGWKKSAIERPLEFEYVRTSSFPFGVALYGSAGFIYMGRDIAPKWWRRVKNGDCLIREIAERDKRHNDQK